MLIANGASHPCVAFCHFAFRSPRPKSDNYRKSLNSLGDHIRARRIDLGLFQSQVAEQIGVHELTVTNWERNATEPEVKYIPAIIRFLGHDPVVSGTSFPEHLAAARRAQGLTQKELARDLGVDPAKVRDWENGQHEPSRKTRGRLAEFLRAK